MAEEKGIIANDQFEKPTSRRSRKDEQGRDFQCGCGKRYLSYPALYTHIKTKHQGRQPQGTQKSGMAQIAKRAKSKLQQQTLRSIYSYFQTSQLKIFSQLSQGISGVVPVGSRIKKDLVPKQIYDCYIGLMKQQQVRLTSHSSLQLALTVYLINIGQHINDKLYEQFLIFSKIAKNCFSEHGQSLYLAYFSKKESGPIFLHNFSISQVKYFPIMSDFIIQSYIPYIYTKQGKQINQNLMELLIFDFCNWLHIHKFTPIKISLHKDFKLDYNLDLLKPRNTPIKADHLKEINSKEIREENQDDSQELSQNEDIQDDQIVDYVIDKKQNSGSKQKESN